MEGTIRCKERLGGLLKYYYSQGCLTSLLKIYLVSLPVRHYRCARPSPHLRFGRESCPEENIFLRESCCKGHNFRRVARSPSKYRAKWRCDMCRKFLIHHHFHPDEFFDHTGTRQLPLYSNP